MPHRYFIVYKPRKMVSQFVSPDAKNQLLGDLHYPFPEGTQAVGRLDEDSEGLLILTTDKTLGKRLLHPERKHSRKYLVHVERDVSAATLERLCSGIEIGVKNRGPYFTLPCRVTKVEEPVNLAPFDGYKAWFPHSWLEFTLTEGKNRQIRKMCAAVHHRCRRLIRTHIVHLSLGALKPGEVREIEKEKLFALLLLE